MSNQQQADPKKQNGQTERLRINRAFQLSIFGLSLAAILVIALVFSGSKERPATDITSIVGLFTSVLGTLIGAFFGLQIGSAGKEKAEERADTAQKKSEALQEVADEGTIKKAKDLYPNLFKK